MGSRRMWKEAASLIMVKPNSKFEAPVRKEIKSGPFSSSSLMNQMEKFFSFVFPSPLPSSNSLEERDFDILMVQRNSKSSFMPNAYVFPGGISEKSDFNSGWKEIFHRFSGGQDPEKVILPDNLPRPFLIQNKGIKESLHRDIVFRINAIRETFEETGIFLHSDKKLNIDDRTLNEWRQKLISQKSSFIEMCSALEVCPDIWNLIEWSDWLTPTDMKEVQTKGRRYDTIFYVTLIRDQISGTADEKEISNLCWGDPFNLLKGYYTGNYWLAPPQIFELSRFLAFQNFEKMSDFVRHRERNGCETMLPVKAKCVEGVFSLLPGDSDYPENPDYENSLNLDFETTVQDIMRDCYKANRLLILENAPNNTILMSNVMSKDGHNIPYPLVNFKHS